MSVDAARIIERGYDEIADRFAEWQRQIHGETRLERAEELLDLLPADASVLEIGIGAGVRSSQLITKRASLTGVDMFFAGFAPETNRALVESAGLVVLRDERETTVEPEYGEARWQWLLARKP